MKKLVSCSLLLATTILGAGFAQADSPSVVGNWNVTFFLETTRSTGATQCITFKLVPGTVAGVATSGTWTSPTFPGWAGQWIQLGDHVRWFGLTPGLATTEAGNMISPNAFGGVSFNHFSKTNAATSSAGSWNAVRVAACRGSGNAGMNEDPSIAPSDINSLD